MRISLIDLAKRFAAMPAKFDATLNVELRRVGARVRDTAVRKFGEYQPAISDLPAWAPLAKSTVAQKARAGGGEDPLIGHYSGARPNTIWPVPLRNTIEWDVRNLRVYVGSADPLMEWHEYGTDNGHIPPRPVLRTAAYETQEYFHERMAEAWAAAARIM